MKIKIDKEMKVALLKAVTVGELDTDLFPELKDVVVESPEKVIRNYFGMKEDTPIPFGIMRLLSGIELE